MSAYEISLFLVKLLAGIGVFLVGVTLLTDNIEQLATGKIKKLFNKTADKRLINVGIGALTTAIIQSSGVTTVLIVGFVNVGVMSLYQATAIIMGANIGTTITAQIAALSTFPITKYVQIFIFVGALISLLTKKEKTKRVASLLSGLGLIFLGLSLMSSSLEDYKDEIQKVFVYVKNPFLLFLIGIFLTALVQSSSATTSVIIAMSVAGLKIGTGGNEVLYIILGTNIGSCVTAIMSSFGANTNAKRASLIHLMFNTFGSIIFFVFLLCYKDFAKDALNRLFPSSATAVAMFHTFFNLVCTIIFLPFSKLFVKLATLIIKDKKRENANNVLDERMLVSPMIAMGQIEKELIVLSDIAYNAFGMAYNSFAERSMKNEALIRGEIEKTENYAKDITDYVIKLSANCTSIEEEKTITRFHNNIGDILRIAEIADNFLKYTNKEIKRDVVFSDEVMVSLNEIKSNLDELFAEVKEYFTTKDKTVLAKIEETEERIDKLRSKNISAHIERVHKGICKPQNSDIFINLVSNAERLGDHLTFIAHSAE